MCSQRVLPVSFLVRMPWVRRSWTSTVFRSARFPSSVSPRVNDRISTFFFLCFFFFATSFVTHRVLFFLSCLRDEFFARTCALRSSPPVLPPKIGDGVFGSSVGSVHFGFSGAAAGASFSSARTTTLARLFPGLPLWMRRVALLGAHATVCMATCFVVGGAANDFVSSTK